MATIKISALPVAVGGDLVATAIVPFDSTTPTTKSTTLLLLRSALLLGGSGYATGDVLALGSNPASSGAIRLANTGAIKARNAANSADVELAQLTAADALKLAGIWTFPTVDGTAGYVIKTDGAGNLSFVAQGGGGAVSSVFGRTGAVVAASNDYTFAQLASIPTTIAGYGITDFNSLGDARWLKLAGGTLTGALLFSTDNTLDVGAVGATRPRTVYVGTSVIAPLFTGALTGNVTGNVTGSSGSTTGNAATATALATARAINGVNFDGTAAITVAAAAGTLTGATLAAGVTASSLTSLGTQASALLFVDNTLDIGASGLTRPRTGYFGTSVIAPLLNNTGSTITLRGVTYTLPAADGSANQVLQTSGGAVLSWATVAGGSGLPTTGGTMTGAILFSADNTIDVGASGATRPRTVYVGTSVIAPNFTGVASSATILATARAINGVNFDGSAAITVTAAAGTLTGATLNSGVTASSLTTLGTLAGNLIFTDATYDIGASGATRPRVGYFSSALAIGTNPSATGAIRLANTGAILGRNAANSADVELAQITAANALKLAGLWTFPTSDGGASTYLGTNGAGALSFGTPPGTTALTLNTQSGTTYTAVLGDADVKLIEMTSASANTVTIPPHSSVAYAAGAVLMIVQGGTGATTVSPGAAVTIRREPWSAGTGVAKGRASALLYTQSSTQDTWYESGSLA